jgi:hypothetical protein
LLASLKSIVDEYIGGDSSQLGWAQDEKSFCDAASDPTFQAALDQQGIIVSVGRSKAMLYVTFHIAPS